MEGALTMRGGVKAIVLGLAVAVVAAGALYVRRAAVDAGPVMLLALEDGRAASVPYLIEEGIVWAVTDEPWWTHLRRGGDGVTLVMDGETIHGRARAVEDDDALRSRMLSRLRPNGPSPRDVLIEVKLAPWALRQRRPS